MQKTLKTMSLRKLAAAALLLAGGAFAMPPAFAQTSPTGTFAFAAVGATTPLSNFDALTVAAESDGTRTFQLDLIYQTSSAPIAGITAFMNFLEEDFEIVEISNVLIAAFVMPNPATGLVVADREETLDGVRYAKAYELNWAAISTLLGVPVANTYVRLLTATIKLKKTAGDTTVNFSGNPGANVVGTELTIQGPPLASVSITPRTMQEIEPFKVTTVTCGLSRPALADTACTLGVGDGSTADPVDDYRVEPALANATITIPKDMESADSVFTFTPNIAGDGGTIDVELSNAVAGGEQVVRDGRPATFIIFAPGLIPGPLNGPVGEVLGNRGGTLQLRAEPRSDVIIDLTVTEGADEIDVNPKTPLTFTTANWSQPQNFFVRGVDDRYDDGDQPFKIVFAVNEGMTRDDNYHDISAEVTGVNIDNDVAALTVSSSPTVVSEQGGANSVAVTVGLTGGILVEADTTVTLAEATGTFFPAGTATAPGDYAAITFPTFTIPADGNSVTETVTITPVDDGAGDNNETIALTATLDPYPVVPLTLALREYHLQVDKDTLVDLTEAGSTDTFSVVLSSPPEKGTGDVVVNVTVDDPSEASASPALLTFTPTNFNMPQVVTVTGENDNLDDGDKDIKVTVSINSGMTGDRHYHGLSHELDGKTIDDDEAMISVSVSPDFLTEDTSGAQAVTFTAELAGDIRLEGNMDVVLAIDTGKSTAMGGGDDYNDFTPPAITINSGQKTGTATAMITTVVADPDPDIAEEEIVFTAALSSYTIADLSLAIREFALKPVHAEPTLTVGEDGSTRSFTLQLPTQPTGDVVVNITSSDTGEATVSPGELKFDRGNWDEAKTVVVSGANDNFDDGAKDFTVNIAVDMDKTMDANYHGRTATVMGETEDDDTATIVLRASPNVLSTGITGAQTVTLTAEVTSVARFEEDVSVIPGTATGTVTSTDATFSTPGNIMIPAAAASGSVDFDVTVLSGAMAGRTIVIPGSLTRAGLPDIAVTSATITLRDHGYNISAPIGQPTEAGGTATFNVSLISQPATGTSVVIDVESSDTTEGAVDTSDAKLTFNDSNWNQVQTVVVAGQPDTVDDGDVRYDITFTPDMTGTTDSNYDNIPTETRSLTTTDDDTVTIAVAASPTDLVENGTAQTVTLTATLTGGTLEKAEMITLRDGGGTATSGSDYDALTLPIMLSIPMGATSGTVDVPITPTDDAPKRDNAETIIFAPALAPYEIDPVALTIREYQLYASELSGAATEPGGEATFTVVLPNRPTGNVVVNLTNDAPDEVNLSANTLTFTTGDWDQPQTVTVTGVNDMFDDGDRPYTITLAVDDNATADDRYDGKTATVSGENADDDDAMIAITANPEFLVEAGGAQAVTFTATLSGDVRLENEAVITLSVSADGTASDTDDFTVFTPGAITLPANTQSASAAPVMITPTADAIPDNNETILINAAFSGAPFARITIPDLELQIREYELVAGMLSADTTEARGTATFGLSLKSPPGGNVVVDVASSAADEAAVAPAKITFTAANWDTPQIITATGVDDNLDDGDQEFTINLTVNNAETDDDNYDGLTASVEGSNTDDDTATLTLAASPAAIAETGGAQPVVITATLGGDVRFAEEMTVSLAKNNAGTATEGMDYDAFTLPTGITIPANAASASVTFAITPVDEDPPVEDDGETILITPTLEGFTLADITITIRELGLVVGALTGDAGENGDTATFTVALAAAPASGRVVVDVTSENTDEATVSPTSLTFTTSDWNQPQTVTVTGVDDNLDDGDQDYTITVAVNDSTDDANYHGISEEVAGSNADDDTASIVLSAAPSLLLESGGEQMVTITASLQGGILLEEDATITLAHKTSGPGAGTATGGGGDYQDFTLPAPITITAGQASGESAAFAITVVDDVDDDEGETIVFSATSTPVYTIADLAIEIRSVGLLTTALQGAATEAGGTATFTLRLVAPPSSGNVVVDVTSSVPQQASVQPAELTFTAANYAMPQLVVISGVDDNLDDGDQPYTINLAVDDAETTDTNYHGITEDITGGMVADNDDAMISLSALPEFLTESGGAQSVVLTAQLAGAVRLPADAVITLGMGTGTATGGGTDYADFTLPTSITIPVGMASASVTFTVSPVADNDSDDNETIVITGALTDYTIADLAIPIREFGIAVGALSGATGENGDTATFTIALTAAPTSNVVLAVAPAAAADRAEVRVTSGANLTFTTSNWNRPQTVTLAGVDDPIVDGRKRFTINIVAVSADANYNNLTATATGMNADDDTAPTSLTLRASPSSISETGGEVVVVVTATFDTRVVLLTPTTVTLSVTTTGDGVAASADYTSAPAIAGATITIPAETSGGATTFRITPNDDGVVDPNEKIVIGGRASGGATIAAGNVTAAEITITEKDITEVAKMVNSTVMPVVSQQAIAGVMANIEVRAASPRDTAPQLVLAGNASVQGALLNYLKAAAKQHEKGEEFRYDWKRALADSSFVMSLDGDAGSRPGGNRGAFWASGERNQLDGDSNNVEWEGESFSIHAGSDVRVGKLLIGAMLSHNETEVDYEDSNAGSTNRGSYTQQTANLRPYFSWSNGGTDIWGGFGGGAGTIEFSDTAAGETEAREATADLTEASAAFGIKQRLVEGFSLQADAAVVATTIDEKTDDDGNVVIAKQEVESGRARLLLENRRTYQRANGVIAPSAQIGLRYDVTEDDRSGPDLSGAEQGSAGAEAVVGVDFVNSASGVTLSGKARIYDGDDYGEWGVSGSIQVHPSGGRGLSLNLQPLYGEAQSSVQKVWNRGFGEPDPVKKTGAENYAASMRGELAYGFAAPGGRGTLTPYTESHFGGRKASQSRKLRLGLRWQPHARFDADAHGEYRAAADHYRIDLRWEKTKRLNLTLRGERKQTDAGASHALVLKGNLDF